MQEFLTVPVILTIALAAIVFLFLYFSAKRKEADLKETIGKLQTEIELRATQQYESWRTKEVEAIRTEQRDLALREARVTLETWKVESETFIRSDAIGRSQSVIIGKVTEHLVPFLPQFHFNPKDARFMGSPVDIIVFDGLDEGELREIYFVEVKTGTSASLTPRQRQIKDAILSGRIRWIELRMERPS